jgi:predicted methyltransferase
MKKSIVLAAAMMGLAMPAIAGASGPKGFAAALANPARPEAHRARDEARKPSELLAFARVKRGKKVADYIMGGGYLTHIMAGAVGAKGVVYAYQPIEFVTYRAAYGTEQDQVAAARANVKPVRSLISDFALPEQVDVIITVQNLHDLYLKPMPPGTPEKGIAALYAALKPGGTLVVVDHVAEAGTGSSAADTIHRIDPAFTRATLEKAGFRFDGELAAWRNSNDPHSANVFDAQIRGKTDQFAYRFRKPK